MVPSSSRSTRRSCSAPRASGDGPVGAARRPCEHRCSPRERGWSSTACSKSCNDGVLPARAGMVPRTVRVGAVMSGCSPRERGWSRHGQDQHLARQRAPRASGDGPAHDPQDSARVVCSPRERGWSTGGRARPIQRARAPRASGDGPASPCVRRAAVTCSPRERGWSSQGVSARQGGGVLPVRAGMVPVRSLSRCRGRSAPRASGDGPRRWPRSAPTWRGAPRASGDGPADLLGRM